MLVFHSLSLYLSRLIVVTRLKSLSSLLMMRAFFARVKVPKRTSHFSNHSNGEKSSFFESIIIIIFIKSVMMSSFFLPTTTTRTRITIKSTRKTTTTRQNAGGRGGKGGWKQVILVKASSSFGEEDVDGINKGCRWNKQRLLLLLLLLLLLSPTVEPIAGRVQSTRIRAQETSIYARRIRGRAIRG